MGTLLFFVLLAAVLAALAAVRLRRGDPVARIAAAAGLIDAELTARGHTLTWVPAGTGVAVRARCGRCLGTVTLDGAGVTYAGAMAWSAVPCQVPAVAG